MGAHPMNRRSNATGHNDVVSWNAGDRVRIVEGGKQVFVIREVPYQGDPARALVESVDDTPGTYPWPALVKYLVAE